MMWVISWKKLTVKSTYKLIPVSIIGQFRSQILKIMSRWWNRSSVLLAQTPILALTKTPYERFKAQWTTIKRSFMTKNKAIIKRALMLTILTTWNHPSSIRRAPRKISLPFQLSNHLKWYSSIWPNKALDNRFRIIRWQYIGKSWSWIAILTSPWNSRIITGSKVFIPHRLATTFQIKWRVL